jgi:hypothetical protein
MSLADRVVDEGLLSHVKTWLSSAHPTPHPSAGHIAKRNRPHRPPKPQSMRPAPNHPAFKALHRQMRAVDSKSETKPAHLAATTTRVSPAHPGEETTPAHSPHRITRAAEPEHNSGVLSTRHKPGTVAHTAHLFKQAKEIHGQVKRPVHVLQRGEKRYISTVPHSGAKVLHTYEQLRHAIAYLRSLIDESTVSGTVGPYMGSINGMPAVDVGTEDPKDKRWKLVRRPVALVQRSGAPIG